MKKLFLFFGLFSALAGHSQDRYQGEENNADKKARLQKLFTGGSLNLGFSSYSTNLGISPQFGYSLAPWADVGVNVGINYISQRDYQYSGDKLRQTLIGPGAFVRLFPVNFLFGTAQFEYNFIRYKYIPAGGSNYAPEKLKLEAPSLLVGGGYASGRERGGNTYYYFSVSWGIMDHDNSPYIDSHKRSLPVIRAGYNIGLFQGRGGNRRF